MRSEQQVPIAVIGQFVQAYHMIIRLGEDKSQIWQFKEVMVYVQQQLLQRLCKLNSQIFTVVCTAHDNILRPYFLLIQLTRRVAKLFRQTVVFKTLHIL